MRALRGVALTLLLGSGLAVTGCSSGHSTNAKTSALSSASTKASSQTGAASAAVITPAPSHSPTTGAQAPIPVNGGDPSVILADHPYYARSVGNVSGTVKLQQYQGMIGKSGVVANIAPGTRVSVEGLGEKVAVVWLGESAVLRVDAESGCASNCSSPSAPSGAKRVLVLTQSAASDISAGAAVVTDN